MFFARVINICSPALFSILYGRAKDFHQFQDYHKALEDCALKELKCADIPLHLQKGMTILAKCSILEGRWTKGVLGELFGSEEWEVVFDNYSVTEIVKKSDVVPCPLELVNAKTPQIKFLSCSLEGIDEDSGDIYNPEEMHHDWSKEGLTFFEKQVKGETLKMASMRRTKDDRLIVDFLIKHEGRSRFLGEVMREKGYLKSSRMPTIYKYLPQIVDSPRVDRVRPEKGADDSPSGHVCPEDDPESVEEICQLLKLSRKEYYELKEFERKPYIPKEYPSVEEMISEALSASFNDIPPNSSHSKANASCWSTNGRTWSGRGRGLSKLIKHFEQTDQQQSEKDVNATGGRTEKVVSKGKENIDQSTNENNFVDKTKRYSIGHNNMNSKDEDETKTDLKDVLFNYIFKGKDEDICLDHIGKIVATDSHSHETLKQGFWWIHDIIMETKELNKHRVENLSCFLASVCSMSRSWTDQRLSKDLLLGNFCPAIKRIVCKIKAAKETKVAQEILVGFMTNFLSKICNFKDARCSVVDIFKSELREVVLSSTLDRHLSNLFLTFLDPDAVYEGYCQAKKNDLKDSKYPYFGPRQPRKWIPGEYARHHHSAGPTKREGPQNSRQ